MLQRTASRALAGRQLSLHTAHTAATPLVCGVTVTASGSVLVSSGVHACSITQAHGYGTDTTQDAAAVEASSFSAPPPTDTGIVNTFSETPEAPPTPPPTPAPTPTTTTTTTTTTTSTTASEKGSGSGAPPRRRRRTLKPVGDVLRVSDKAKERIMKIVQKENVEGIRIAVQKGGCSGFEFSVDLIEGPPDKLDAVVNLGDAKVIVDGKALLFVLGSELDVEVKKGISQEFVINNEALDKCGCGVSFAPKGAKPNNDFLKRSA